MEPVGDAAAKYSTKPGSWRIAGMRYLPVSRVMRSTSSKRAGSKVPRDTRITADDGSVVVVIEQYSSRVPLVRRSRSCLLRVGHDRNGPQIYPQSNPSPSRQFVRTRHPASSLKFQ